jgi:hypothetical protein
MSQDDLFLENAAKTLTPSQVEKFKTALLSPDRENQVIKAGSAPGQTRARLRIHDPQSGVTAEINHQFQIVNYSDLYPSVRPPAPPLNEAGLTRARPQASLFKGLGDAKTSPWLNDGRVGVRTHIEEFRAGGSFLIRKKTFERLIKAGDPIGREDGLFITTRASMDKLFEKSGKSLELIKKGMGIPENQWNEPLIRIDVTNPLLHDARMASGIEQGANELFMWGGYTKGGMPEIAIDSVKTGEYIVVEEIPYKKAKP